MVLRMVLGDEVMLSNCVDIYCLWMSRSMSMSAGRGIVDLQDVVSNCFDARLNICE